MSRVTATEARATLPEILDRVDDGDEVTITRHGRAIAVMIRPDALRVRRAEGAFRRADEVGALLDRAARIRLSDAPGLAAGRADELVAGLGEERTRSTPT
jgi:antitoxin (DNA-binding transcriptional repressor) of toxin-antitoxin stability system